MRSLNNFLEANWMLTYKSTDQMWLSDALNWEKTSSLVASDWSLASFLFQSSFINQHLLIDQISKTSYLDMGYVELPKNIQKYYKEDKTIIEIKKEMDKYNI